MKKKRIQLILSLVFVCMLAYGQNEAPHYIKNNGKPLLWR